MTITVKTFAGHNINDGADYQAVGLTFNTPATASLIFVNQANNDPAYAGVFTGAVRTLTLGVRVNDVSNLDELVEQLKVWMKRGASGLLVATFPDTNDYQIYCTVQALQPEEKYSGIFTVVLQAGASSWVAVNAETDSWAANSSTLTKEITVGGAEETRLCLTVMPGTAGSGWSYQYLYQLVNVPAIDYGSWPWCIALDTAALVTAGKLQADCDDLRVVVNGIETKRWLADANTNHTHIWFNLDIGEGYSLTLATAIPASGAVGEISFAKTANNKKALTALPASGMLYHGTEWIQYSGKDLKTFKVGVIKSGALGTTRQLHAAGTMMKYIQHVVFVLAGNASATDPAADDADYDVDKPVFDLSASDNTSWVYTASTLFYDATLPARPGSWTPAIEDNGTLAEYYEFSQNAGSGAPAAGAYAACWQKGTTWVKETAEISWKLYCPGGISSVTATGSKYRSTVRWPLLAGLQKSNNGTTWTTIWNETMPVSVSTWTAFSHGAASISPATKWARFALSGNMAALANAAAYFEILTATVAFSSGNLPAGTLLSQTANFALAVRISNAENDDAMELSLPMLIGKVLDLDGEAYEAVYDGVNVHGAMKLSDDSRDVWIRLIPGGNTLEIAPLTVGDDIGGLTIGLSWYPRRP